MYIYMCVFIHTLICKWEAGRLLLMYSLIQDIEQFFLSWAQSSVVLLYIHLKNFKFTFLWNIHSQEEYSYYSISSTYNLLGIKLGVSTLTLLIRNTKCYNS